MTEDTKPEMVGTSKESHSTFGPGPFIAITLIAAGVVVAGADQHSERARLEREVLDQRCMAVDGVFLERERICLRSDAVIDVGG